MPFDYRRDDEQCIIRLTAVEPVGLLDVTLVLDRQLAEGTWRYGMLVDARRAILSRKDSQSLQEHIRKLAAEHGPHGPVALVTRLGEGTPQAYGIGSVRAGLPFDVFWDIEEAEKWLGSHPRPPS
jgi:hypothetical protein